MSSLAHWDHETVSQHPPAGPERAIEMVATRFVKTWGFTTIDMVAWRFRMLRPLHEPRAVLARRALAGRPDLHWLDPTCEWFSLLDCASPMKTALAKIVATVGEVERDELRLALGKRNTFRDAPPVVIQTYLTTLLEDARRTTRAAPRPSREEAALVTMLRAAGGWDDVHSLRRRACDLGLDPLAVARTLQSSPLFLRTGRGTYRLIGSPVGCPVLITSGGWAATV